MPKSTTTTQYERAVRRAIYPPLITMLLLVFLLLMQVLLLRDAARWVAHTHAVLAKANGTLKLLVDMETGIRGYLVGGKPLFLEPYVSALHDADPNKNIAASFADLKNLVRDNKVQQNRVVRIKDTYQNWLRSAEIEIALRKRNDPGLRAYFDQARGKAVMDDIRAQFEQFTDNEYSYLAQREQVTNQQTVATLAGSGIFALIFGTLLTINTRRQMRFLSNEHEKVMEAEQVARENLSITLTSIGDGVIVTDAKGRVTLLNGVAEKLTGWGNAEAKGQSAAIVFDIVNETTRELVESPVAKVLREGTIAGLANHTVLRRRDGSEIPIDDSGAPIRDTNGNLSGVVVVFRDITERKHLEQELIESAAKQSRIAETLQQSLLLAPPKGAFPNLSVSTLYEAAWDEAKVGGDFFDAIHLREDAVALVVGDVTGKGLAAASHTAEIKFALRAFLFEDLDPAAALQRLNSFLVESHTLSETASFVSVMIAIVNTRTGETGISNGGGELPLIARADGSIEEIVTTGAVLGASSDVVYDLQTICLAPGDVLLFLTDGVTEARSPARKFFGSEGLMDAVKAVPQSDDFDTFTQTVYTQVHAFADGKLHDDICLLAARLEQMAGR